MLAVAGAFALSPAAVAEDWRTRIGDAPQLRRTIGPAADASSVALAGSMRLGMTDNADADFVSRSSPFVRTRNRLELRRSLGLGVAGLSAGGTFERAMAADETARADLDVAASYAAPVGDRVVAGVEASYEMETEYGFRSHDFGVAVEAKAELGSLDPFAIVTANDIRHDPLDVGGLVYDASDSDRLRLGLEAGAEVPLADTAVASVSAGYLGHDYRLRRDALGFSRGNRSWFGRGALTLSTDRLAAEFGAIAMHRAYDDPRYDDMWSVLGEARLVWRAADATVLSASYVADLEEPVLAGMRTIRTDEVALSLAHALTDTLTGTAALYAERNRYLGTVRADRTYGAALEFAHALSDATALDMAIGYERLESSLLDDRVDIWKVSTGLRYALAAD